MTNNTDRSFKFSLTDFSFPCVSYDQVANEVEFNTTKRVTLWGIGAFFIFPLIIPAIMEAVESPKANQQLYTDFAKKSLTDQIIAPYETINGLIFVASEHFDLNFSFTVTDKINNKKFKLSTCEKQLNINSTITNNLKNSIVAENDYDNEDDFYDEDIINENFTNSVLFIK